MLKRERRLLPLGDDSKNQITGLVTQSVVHVLEAVQIQCTMLAL